MFNRIQWPQKRIIYDRDGRRPYMIRYYLAFNRKKNFQAKKKILLFNIYLHHILLSDEPVLHDHPWNWTTLVLKGGYFETTPQGRFWRGPGSLRFAKATEMHYLEINEGQPCWTLFMRGQPQRVWGFATAKGWLDYKAYLRQRKAS
jgi:hypothetical protein